MTHEGFKGHQQRFYKLVVSSFHCLYCVYRKIWITQVITPKLTYFKRIFYFWNFLFLKFLKLFFSFLFWNFEEFEFLGRWNFCEWSGPGRRGIWHFWNFQALPIPRGFWQILGRRGFRTLGEVSDKVRNSCIYYSSFN